MSTRTDALLDALAADAERIAVRFAAQGDARASRLAELARALRALADGTDEPSTEGTR